jgi:glycosyltransferase involved in cell wall biosynthesis
MRVCHVIDNMFPDRGGPVSVVAGLAMAQQRANDVVDVVCRRASRDGSHRASPHISIIETGEDTQRALDRALDAVNPDVLHLHGLWEPIQRHAAKWGRRHAVPWVVSTHGMLHRVPMHDGYLKKRAYLLVLGIAVNGARRLLVTNNEESDFATRVTGVPATVVPNGVDMADFANPDTTRFRSAVPGLGDSPYLLFLGRIHEIKGLDGLIRSFARVRRNGLNVELVLAGPADGAVVDVQRESRAQGVEPHVHLVGPLYGEDRSSAMAGCSLFVHRPRYEGFGMAIVEAMAASRPVVTTSICGVARACPPGVLVCAPDSDEGFAASMTSALRAFHGSEAMGRRACNWVAAKLSWDSVAALVRPLYA